MTREKISPREMELELLSLGYEEESLSKKKASLSFRSDLVGLAAPFHAKLINEIVNELFGE